MDLKPLAKTLLERSVNLALASGLSPADVQAAVYRIRQENLPEFGLGMEPRARPQEVVDLVCLCADSIVLLLGASRPEHPTSRPLQWTEPAEPA